MSRRNVVFATNEIYHVYNRSIAKEQIFTTQMQLKKALEIINYYRFPQRLSLSKYKQLSQELKKNYLLELENKSPIVEIYSFALMPNHFHFLIKQLVDKGIIRFISNFQNSFAKYYNLKNDRDGAVFKNQFKGKWIESEEQCLHTSRYIHLNPVLAYIIPFKQLASYPWTSFSAYAIKGTKSFIQTDFLLNMFSTQEKYIDFIADQIDYQKKIVEIKHLMFDE